MLEGRSANSSSPQLWEKEIAALPITKHAVVTNDGNYIVWIPLYAE